MRLLLLSSPVEVVDLNTIMNGSDYRNGASQSVKQKKNIRAIHSQRKDVFVLRINARSIFRPAHRVTSSGVLCDEIIDTHI